MDFISLDSFAGFAPGITWKLWIDGLEVPDKERIKEPAKRKRNPKQGCQLYFPKKRDTKTFG